MTSKTLTDSYGGTLEFRLGPAGLAICAAEDDRSDVGPFDPAVIRAALDEVAPVPAGSSLTPREHIALAIAVAYRLPKGALLPARTPFFVRSGPGDWEYCDGADNRIDTSRFPLAEYRLLDPYDPPRPAGAAGIEELLREVFDISQPVSTELPRIADALASRGVHVPPRACGLGPCSKEDGHDGGCSL